MTEYARSKDLHKTLRSVWDASFKPLGYKRCKGSLASYFRLAEDGKHYTRFWAQASQWGNSWSGNSFTINFDASLPDPSLPFGGSDRILGEMEATDILIANQIANKILTRKPKPPADHWIYNEMSNEIKNNPKQRFWTDTFDQEFNTPIELKSNTDIWLPYYSTVDVQEWAAFLTEILPKLFSIRTERES